MAYSSNNTRFVIVACLVVVGLVVLGQNAVHADFCGANIGDLILQCGVYVQKGGIKIPPSAGCCSVVKGVDVPCACQHLPKGAEDLVSLDKVVYVARSCGIKLQAGTNCGSYTIPPPRA